MLLADFNDLMWAKELPHKELILTVLYNVPGGILVALAMVVVRMLIEEVLKHISQTLSQHKLWSWLCVIMWMVIMKTTPIGDAVARKIHWDQLFPAPKSDVAPQAAPQQLPPRRR